MGKQIKLNQRVAMKGLATRLLKSTDELVFAQNIANAVVEEPSNHCAATMSSLLIFEDIYPVGVGKGYPNIEQAVKMLATELVRLGWKRTDKSQIGKLPFESGDLGVVDTKENGKEVHHIYLILDAADQKKPLIADNQAPPHHRPVDGGVMPDLPNGATETTYFLRAPDAEHTFELLDIPIV